VEPASSRSHTIIRYAVRYHTTTGQVSSTTSEAFAFVAGGLLFLHVSCEAISLISEVVRMIHLLPIAKLMHHHLSSNRRSTDLRCQLAETLPKV